MSVILSEKSDHRSIAEAMCRYVVDSEARRSGIPVRAAAAVIARRTKFATSAVVSLYYRELKRIEINLYFPMVDLFEREANREIEALENVVSKARQSGNPAHLAKAQEIVAELQIIRDEIAALKPDRGL